LELFLAALLGRIISAPFYPFKVIPELSKCRQQGWYLLEYPDNCVSLLTQIIMPFRYVE